MKLTRITKTFTKETNDRNWKIVDANGVALGRLATTVANMLRGKDKPEFSKDGDCGDFVIIINAEKVMLTGQKTEKKIYYKHSGHLSGLKATLAKDMDKEVMIRTAIKGMLPKCALSDSIIAKLKVYKGEAHPHAAQKPVKLEELN
jgi:large subunit ribosomal protein L13